MQITSSVPQAFARNESLLVNLKADWKPEAVSDLAELSSETLVEARAPLPANWRETAGQLTLTALSQGLLCGALDGAILYQTGQLAPLADKASGDEGLLLKNMNQAREVADQSWRSMGADDLQLLSGYGKHQNRSTLEEGQQAAQGTGDEFRTFLLATFKAGYALGMVDSAVVFVAGEKPGQEANPSTAPVIAAF